MFCPKCGLQNADETRFCRGCGADLSNVLAVIDGGSPKSLAIDEKYIHRFSSGVRGLTMGIGFLIVAAIAYGISARLGVLTVFALAFGFVFLSAGISRMVQARAIKKLREPKKTDPALSPGTPDYITPPRSVYQTDDLATPRSVTEHTTRHLEPLGKSEE